MDFGILKVKENNVVNEEKLKSHVKYECDGKHHHHINEVIHNKYGKFVNVMCADYSAFGYTIYLDFNLLEEGEAKARELLQ